MRCGEAVSATAQTGHSDEIHSPEEWASTVMSRTSPAASSIAVVWTVAISYLPSLFRPRSRPLDNGAYRKRRSPFGEMPARVPQNDFPILVNSSYALQTPAHKKTKFTLEGNLSARHHNDQDE